MNVDKPRTINLGVSVEYVDPQELYQVLVDASSQVYSRVQSSSQRLKQMLDMVGTFDALQEIAVQRTVPTPVRQQAIIQFKNGALGHWRSRKLLTDEQRHRIRSRTLTLLDEPDETISECNEIVVAKIARQDFPTNWGDLFDNVMNTIGASLANRYSGDQGGDQDALVLKRSLRIVNSVVKEFASIKMPNGMKTMANIVQGIRDQIYGYYTTLATNLFNSLNPETITTERMLQDLGILHILYKIVIKMAIWTWQRIEKYSREEAASQHARQSEIFAFSYNYVQSIFPLRKNIVQTLTQEGKMRLARKGLNILTKHLRTYGKYFRRLQQLGGQRFVELPHCGELVLFYWTQVVDATAGPPQFIEDTDEAIYPIRFLVQGMVLFKESLIQWAPRRRDGTENPRTLPREFIEEAATLLITRFMPLNPTDLESWMNDPEEWLNIEDKENDQWEYELRPCSERVLLQLMNNYSDYIVPLMSASFQQSAVTPAVDLQSVIQKEALYCALGRCANRLQNEIPFDQWLQRTLVVEAKESINPNYPIIKRRIAWLIGKWVSEECTSVNNPLIWDVLVHLLKDRGPATDTVVRLTAAKALRECMDTVNFSVDYFLPHLATTISEFVRLIGEAETFESKRRVDEALNIVIERNGAQVTPFVPIIVAPLPELWTTAEDDWLFKASLLVTVTKLLEAVKEESSNLGSIVIPLIRESLAPSASTHLDEDGINLWLSALRNTNTVASVNGAPGLFELVPEALRLLATNMDLLGSIINIIESYMLLDVNGLTQAHGADLCQAFSMALRSGGSALNMKDLLVALNLLVLLAPSSAWAAHFHSSGLFAYILDKVVDNESSTMILTEYIYLFARIVMVDPQAFLQLISAAAVQLNQKESYLMEGLLDQWWGKFDNMGEPRNRKLTAMGIAAFVSTGRKEVLERLPTEIFNIWLDVFGEIKEARNFAAETEDGSSPPLRRYWDIEEVPSWFYQGTEGTPEYDRRKAVYDADPIRVVQLNTYIAERLGDAERNSDQQIFKECLAKADPMVFKQIYDEISLRK